MESNSPAPKSMPKLCAVIPAYNEEAHIENVIRRTLPYVDAIVVVDDGSRDRTFEVARSVVSDKLFVLRHRVNLGKGASLKTGCIAAQQLGAEIVVTLDGDGQHPSEFIPQLAAFLQENSYDVVFTVRRGGDTMPLVRKMGTAVLAFAVHVLFRMRLQDMWCGFRAFRVDVLDRMVWTATDYSGEIEMVLRVGLNHLKYGEYVIPTVYLDASKGVTVMHGLKLLGQMLLWRITL